MGSGKGKRLGSAAQSKGMNSGKKQAGHQNTTVYGTELHEEESEA